jgi:O-antigen/teichoic acid export membrane protein
MNRTRNSAWNFAGGLTFAIVSAATSLLATPWLLQWLGAERLGAFKALTDWLSYLTFLELGLSGALMAALAIRIGQDDRTAVARMVAAGLHAYTLITPVMLSGGICLVVALPYLLSPATLSRGELRMAGALAILPILLTPLLTFRALAEARQRSYLYWLLMSVQVLLLTGLSLLMARAGWGLIGQGLAYAVAQVPTLIVLAWDGIKAYSWTWRASPNRKDREALWGLSWPTFIHGLTDRVGLAGDNIIIAWVLGPAALVSFYLTQQLSALAQSQLKGLSQATWAGLVELYAQGEYNRFRLRLLELTHLISGLGLAALGPIAAYNRYFVEFWVGRENYAGMTVTGLACLNVFLWSVYSLWGWALLGTGHIRRWVPFATISTLVNISVSLVGTFTLGVVGPLLGTITALLLITSWALPRILKLVFEISPWALWRAALIPLRWGILYLAVMWIVARNRPPQGWLELIISMGIWTAGGVSLWWKLSLGKAERTEWYTRIRRVVFLP